MKAITKSYNDRREIWFMTHFQLSALILALPYLTTLCAQPQTGSPEASVKYSNGERVDAGMKEICDHYEVR